MHCGMVNENIPTSKLQGPKIDRRTTVKLFMSAGIAGLAGCTGGGSGEPSSTDEDGSVSGVNQVMTAAWVVDDIPRLDLAMETDSQFSNLAANIFSAPLRVNANYELEGDLANDWSVEDDGNLIVLNFRDDVVFHNGDEFTAEDIEFSITRTINGDSPFSDRYTDISDMNVIDETTLELELEQPNAPMLTFLTKGLGQGAVAVPKDYHEEVGIEEYQEQPVGTGPFEIASWESGTRLTLNAFDDYYATDSSGNQLPYLDTVHIDPIPETSTMVSALQTGDVHMANRVGAENVEQINTVDDASISTVRSTDWWGIAMNTTREPFGNPRVRRAFAKLLDPQEFIENAQFGEGVPSGGPIPPAVDWAARTLEEKHEATDGAQAFAPEEGRQILEEEGVADVSIELLSSPNFERWMRNVRSQLTEHVPDLDVSLRQVQQSEYWSIKGRPNLDYDMAMAFTSGIADPDIGMWNFYRQPDQGGVWNETGYSPETSDHATRVNELLGQQRREVDQETRKELLWEAEDLLIEDCVDAYLLHTNDLVPIRDDVQGFDHPPNLRPLDYLTLDE